MIIHRSQRFLLWLAAAVLLILLYGKGHCPPSKGSAVAFLHSSTALIKVRVKGEVPSSGIYRFPDGVKLGTVMNMTQAESEGRAFNKSMKDAPLKSGDIVEFGHNSSQLPEITITSMKAKERMVLGIPLNPDQMDAGEWDALPGIGPELAKRIVADRQRNGDYCSLEALKRVPGIGEKKLFRIREFFAER